MATELNRPSCTRRPRPLLWAVASLVLSTVVFTVNVGHITPLDKETSAMGRRIQHGQQRQQALFSELVGAYGKLPAHEFLNALYGTVERGNETWVKLRRPFHENYRHLVRARTGERLGLWLSTLFCLAATVALRRRMCCGRSRKGVLLLAAFVSLGACVFTAVQLVSCERLAYRAYGGFRLPEASLFLTSSPSCSVPNSDYTPPSPSWNLETIAD